MPVEPIPTDTQSADELRRVQIDIMQLTRSLRAATQRMGDVERAALIAETLRGITDALRPME